VPFIKAGQLTLMKSSSICFDVTSEPSPDDSQQINVYVAVMQAHRLYEVSSFLDSLTSKVLNMTPF